MELHRAAKGAYRAIRTLYKSAFQRNERAPFFFIKRRAMQNRATMLVAEENDKLIGFAYTVEYKDLVYLSYFAVAEGERGSGNGSEIIRLLKAYYPNRRIFLAREPLDDTAHNRRERINRRNFYIHNGFNDQPFKIKEAGVVYDVMSTSEELDRSDYDALIQNWAGGLVLRLVKMESIG